MVRLGHGGTRPVVVAFAAKLRLAASTLGCNSRKDICARFRAVNKSTECDLDRLNKWMQGRSLPRAVSVYADFAAVIGTAKSGHWIANCSIEEFTAELAHCTGTEVAALAIPDSSVPRGNPRGTGLFGGVATLSGAFAAYSPAWSPHFRGRLIRGGLRLSPSRRETLIATYSETLFGRDVRLMAEAWIFGRSMHFVVREPDGDVPLFISLQIPGPPASVLCGIMSGAAFVSQEPLQSACRIIFIRVPDTPRLDATSRYFDPIPGSISADLADLGLAVPEADHLDALTREFLGAAPIQVTNQHQGTFAAILDREHLDAAG